MVTRGARMVRHRAHSIWGDGRAAVPAAGASAFRDQVVEARLVGDVPERQGQRLHGVRSVDAKRDLHEHVSGQQSQNTAGRD